jgi:hypothetical protein
MELAPLGRVGLVAHSIASFAIEWGYNEPPPSLIEASLLESSRLPRSPVVRIPEQT